MRTSWLALSGALALLSQPSCVAAQTAPPDKPAQAAPAQPDRSDDASSPSTPPKARQGLKEEGTNRVDALSPDEMRRLQRIRDKADAAKSKAAPSTRKVAVRPATPAFTATRKSVEPKRVRTKPVERPTVASPAPERPARQRAAVPAVREAKAPASIDRVERKPRSARQATHLHVRVADLDQRRPSRRAQPQVAARGPRVVGNVVPPGTRFRPMPYGYDPRFDGYGPRRFFFGPRRFAYGPRDFYDEPPPRRFFIEPY